MKVETEFILQCNRNSFIEQVMYSREELDTTTLLNQPLLFCLSPEYLETGRRFLEAIRWNGKAENFDLEILLNQQKVRFSFSGVLLRDHIILVAQQIMTEENEALPVEKMVAGEVLNNLAEADMQAASEQESEVTVWDLLEEMSRLNNELINTKRELIRKNLELERLQQQLKNQ